MATTREAQRRYQAAWRKANPDKVKAKRDRYYMANRAKILARKSELKKIRRAANLGKERAYSRVYYAEHKEHLKALARKYYRQNPERQKASSKRYRREYPERAQAAVRAWVEAHPEQAKACFARRRAREANAPINDFTADQWAALQIAFDHRCAYCDRRCKGRLTQDHVIPLSKGGAHTASNIVPACKNCNSRKHTGPPLRPVQMPLLV